MERGDGARTRDIQLGRLALYQLSYPRAPHFTSAVRSASLSLPIVPLIHVEKLSIPV